MWNSLAKFLNLLPSIFAHSQWLYCHQIKQEQTETAIFLALFCYWYWDQNLEFATFLMTAKSRDWDVTHLCKSQETKKSSDQNVVHWRQPDSKGLSKKRTQTESIFKCSPSKRLPYWISLDFHIKFTFTAHIYRTDFDWNSFPATYCSVWDERDK